MDLEALKRAKREMKMTIAEIAEKANLPKGTVQNIFAGYVPNPRSDTVEAIERALGLRDSGLKDKGMGKTGDEVYSLMNQIFKGAIAHGLIARNPLAVCYHEPHVRSHGKALTRAQEAILAASSSPYRVLWLIVLYTGMRPNEYTTLRREGDMLICKNSKRKHKREEFKRIPINPMLAPVIGDMQSFDWPKSVTLYRNLRKVLPDFTLYDLRTTFYTRCQECGVAPAARDEMVGHSAGKLADTYTDLSDDFLRKEAAKIDYSLDAGERAEGEVKA